MRNLSGRGKAGLLIFVIINTSFIFLLLSPYIPNLIGEYRDDQLLAGCDARIQQYRTGPIQIHLENASDGTPIQGWNVSFTHVKHEFFFGCNAYAFNSFANSSDDDTYKDFFKNLFNLAVIGFYWPSYENPQGIFHENKINATITWCIQNNITTKGHPLAWTRSIPNWLPLDNNTLVAELLENRITTIVSKYKGLIDHWDVVNEPAHTATFAGWSRADYVRNCLLWANASNPTADHLTVNDYGILGHDFGYGPYHNLLADLNALNAPFNSIGFQLHEPRTDWVPATEIWRTMDGFSDLGKPIHITEYSPVSAAVPITNSWKKGMWSEENQAEYAQRVYKLLFSHPTCGGIIWWDLADSFSWIEEGGLLRADLTPKPVYTGLDQLINNEWRTLGSQLTDPSGNVQFQGFHGIYNVTVENGDTFLISAEAGATNQFNWTI